MRLLSWQTGFGLGGGNTSEVKEKWGQRRKEVTDFRVTKQLPSFLSLIRSEDPTDCHVNKMKATLGRCILRKEGRSLPGLPPKCTAMELSYLGSYMSSCLVEVERFKGGKN